jgi:hypothetical protein
MWAHPGVNGARDVARGRAPRGLATAARGINSRTWASLTHSSAAMLHFISDAPYQVYTGWFGNNVNTHA